jgi:hypothetical protein
MNKKKYKESRQYTNLGEKEVIDKVDKFCKKKGISRNDLTTQLYRQFLGLPLEEEIINTNNMSMETLTSDFYSGELSQEEYERNGIKFDTQEEITENIIEEIKLVEPQEETFKFHIRVKNEGVFFEEDREIKAFNRRQAEIKLEKELDAYEDDYTYQLI